MKKLIPYLLAAASICSLIPSSSAQISVTSGVDPNARSNGSYAAVDFWNFSNADGVGEFTSGTANSILANPSRYDLQTWSQQTFDIQFTYAPTRGYAEAQVSASGLGTTITIPSTAPAELQILVANTGLGDLTLTLDSINSVAYGGILNGPTPYVYGGTPPTFTTGSTLSAANGEALQAYLDDPTIFSQAFTLNATITLDSPANSVDYGDGLNSLIEFNLAPIPEPSTGWLVGIGLGALALPRLKFNQRRAIR